MERHLNSVCLKEIPLQQSAGPPIRSIRPDRGFVSIREIMAAASKNLVSDVLFILSPNCNFSTDLRYYCARANEYLHAREATTV